MRARQLAFLLLLVGGAVVVEAQAQTIFRMDYSTLAGWNPVATSANFDRRRIDGAGPAGQPVYELIQRHAPGTRDYGGQFSWGWWGDVESDDPAAGSRRYYRWRMRFSPDTNFRGISWADGGASGMQNKLLIVGNACGRRCRFILSYQTDGGVSRVRNFRLQLDGGVDLADTGSFPVGQWLDVQVELQASSAGDQADGGYKIWINNNNYSSPDAQRTGIVLNPTLWRNVLLGGYMNDGLAADGVHTFQQTDFQVASTFDAQWDVGGTSAGTSTARPSPITDLRAVAQ